MKLFENLFFYCVFGKPQMNNPEITFYFHLVFGLKNESNLFGFFKSLFFLYKYILVFYI